MLMWEGNEMEVSGNHIIQREDGGKGMNKGRVWGSVIFIKSLHEPCLLRGWDPAVPSTLGTHSPVLLSNTSLNSKMPLVYFSPFPEGPAV